MRVKTKFTLATAAVLFAFLALFLIANTVFIIHESLLVRRHELRLVAKRIDKILDTASAFSAGKIRSIVLEGIKFVSKPGCLKLAVFDGNGNLVVSTPDYAGEALVKRNYPSKEGGSFATEQWKSWYRWDTDLYFTGKHCFVKLNDTQNIEIEDDISLFFFVALPVIALLSLIGGGFLGAAATRQVRRIETAAAVVAAGDLGYRIPESGSGDEMAAMEHDLNKMFAELERSFNAVMEFSSDLAHELRTPLTVMTGELEVGLREARTPEEYQLLIAKTMEEVAFLKRMIEDMLILVKPRAAYIKDSFEKVEFSELVADTMESMQLLSETKSVELSAEIADGVKITGNPSLLKMLMHNLVHNAIKYTRKNGKVTVALSETNGAVALTVSDDGPGIPEKERESVFKRFNRLKRDRDNGSSGSGLGLAIVKKVCEVHDADITLESSPSGTIFKVVWRRFL